MKRESNYKVETMLATDVGCQDHAVWQKSRQSIYLRLWKWSRSSKSSLFFSWSITAFCFSMTWLVGISASPVCIYVQLLLENNYIVIGRQQKTSLYITLNVLNVSYFRLISKYLIFRKAIDYYNRVIQEESISRWNLKWLIWGSERWF